MEKEVQEKWVFFTKHELNSPMDIGVHASQDEPLLKDRAARNGLKTSGPLEHAYWDMAVQGKPHILEIWLPVQKEGDKESIPEMKLVPKFRCLSATFKRPIEEIGDAWMEIGALAKEEGYQLTNHDREIYRTMDCDNPKNNDIELQLGIK